MASIVFMRHGQAENNTRRVLAGRTGGIRLTDLGRRQAEGAARLLEGMGIGAIYCSPIERARHTAEIAGRASGIAPVVDERLTELEMGRFTGMRYDDIATMHGNVFLRFYSGDEDIARSGVETFASVRERVCSVAADVASRHPDTGVLLVTHMDPIKAMLAETMGLSAGLLTRMVIANASMTVFGRGEDSLYARAVNVVEASRYAQDW